MKNRILLLWIVLFAALSSLSYAHAAAVVSSPSTAAKAAWQQDWERTLAAAKKEGKLVVLNSFGSEGRIAIAKAFHQKYGLDMEFITGRTGKIDAKVSTERRAGLYLADVYAAGTGSLTSAKKLRFSGKK